MSKRNSIVMTVLVTAFSACLMSPEAQARNPSFRKPVAAQSYFEQAFGVECPAHSVCHLPASPGGIIDTFEKAAAEVVRDGDTIVIERACNSSCERFADLARKNVCITADVEMGVHMATSYYVNEGDAADALHNPEKWINVTRFKMPQSRDINQAILASGGYPRYGVHYLSQKLERQFWRLCPESISG
jgi:hypothetical protein